MTLKSKLLAAGALSEVHAERLYGHNSMSSMAEGNWMPVGAKAENERLLPLLTAMAEVCEASDKIKYKLDHNSGLELVWAIKELRKMVEK